MRKDFLPVPKDNPWIFTTKNGPTGHSLTTCYEEIKLLTDEIIEAMTVILGESTISKVRQFGSHLSGEGDPYFSSVKALFNIGTDKRPYHAKITTIPDKEGKSRNIAMGSY